VSGEQQIAYRIPRQGGLCWNDVKQLQEEARFWDVDDSEGGRRLASYFRDLSERVAREIHPMRTV
jgi:hypothetical protein